MEPDGIEFGRNVLRVMSREHVWPFSWGICPEVPATSGMEDFKYFPMCMADENLYQWYQPMPNFVWDTSIIRPAHSCGDTINGVNIFETACGYWNCLPIRWVASDDGVHSQNGPDGRPDATQWANMVRRLCTYRGTDALTLPWNVEKPIIGVEHLPDGYTAQPDVEMGIFAAMANAYEETFEALENKGKWDLAWVAPITDVNVCIQSLDEDDASVVLSGMLNDGTVFNTPAALKLKKDVTFTGKVTGYKDDGVAVVVEQQFTATEGLLVTFRFTLSDCKCKYWLDTWNFNKWIRCIFGGIKRCH